MHRLAPRAPRAAPRRTRSARAATTLMDPIGFGLEQLRRDRPVPHDGQRLPDRRHRHAARRGAVHGPRRARRALGAATQRLPLHGREALHVHAGRPPIRIDAVEHIEDAHEGVRRRRLLVPRAGGAQW